MKFPEPSNKNIVISFIVVSSIMVSTYLQNPKFQEDISHKIGLIREKLENFWLPKKDSQPQEGFVYGDSIATKEGEI